MKRFLMVVIASCLCCVCWNSPSAFAQEPILVGVPTSVGSLEGKESINAVKMAVDEINAKGGVKVGGVRRPIRIEIEDLRDSSPGVPVTEALLGIEKIIEEKKVKFIVVGPFRSEALLAGMDIVSDHKVPMLGTIAVTPASAQKVKENPDKYKYCFRVCEDARDIAGYIIQTIGHLNKEFGLDKAFALHQDVLWCRATAKGVMDTVSKKFGVKDVGSEAYPTGTSDFSAGLSKAKGAGAQIIVPVFDMPQSGVLVKQWRSMQIPAILAGFISPLSGPGAWKTFEGKIGGVLNETLEIGSAVGANKYPPSMEFCERYLKKYGTPMQAGHGPAPSYDAVYVLAEAIERADSLDPDKVVAELKKTDYRGVQGRVRFNEGNQAVFGDDPAETCTAAVAQWTEDGKQVVVFPLSVADAKIKLPDWFKAPKK